MPNRPKPVGFPLPDGEHFDEIIDVRAPIEYADDHIIGAINLPVLFDEERQRIGTQYKHESSFEAQRDGAALVSRNIARHLETHLSTKPRDYRALLYCYRGGQRSRSLATVMAEIGWGVAVIKGGYKAYRRHVIDTLESRSEALTFRVISGLTGSGKTLFLRSLEDLGAQVLDLEGLANHKGSVFGDDFESPQPAQRRFETLIYDRLSMLDAERPVYVESESSKIGRLSVPPVLLQRMRAGVVAELVAPFESRVDFLFRDYEAWLKQPDWVAETLDRLEDFRSAETLRRWKEWTRQERWRELIGELLEQYYDRHYGTGGSRKYRKAERRIMLDDTSGDEIHRRAAEFLENEASR